MSGYFFEFNGYMWLIFFKLILEKISLWLLEYIIVGRFEYVNILVVERDLNVRNIVGCVFRVIFFFFCEIIYKND